MGLPPTSYPRTPPVRRRGLLPCSPLGMHRHQLQVVLWQETGSGQYIQSQAYGCTEQTENAMLLRQEDRVKMTGTTGLPLYSGACNKRTSVLRLRVCGADCCQAPETCKRILQGESDFPSQASLRALLRCPSQLPGRLQLKPKPSLLQHN